MHVCIPSWFSCVQLFVTPWTVACQAPLSMGFSKQEYGSGSLPPPGDPEKGILITSSRGSWEAHLSIYLSIYLSTHTYIYVHIYVCENLEGQYNLSVYLEDEVWGKRWGCQDRIIGKQRWRPEEKFWLNVLCNLLKSWRVKTSRILFLTLISILIFKEVDNNVQRA